MSQTENKNVRDMISSFAKAESWEHDGYEDEDEHHDVCCVGCGEFVCYKEEEPDHKDERDEAICEDCYKEFHGEEDEDTCKTCNEIVFAVNICDTCNECCDPSRVSRCCECEE